MIAEAGHEGATADAFASFDAAFFQFIRMIRMGEVPRKIMARLGLDLDIAQFHMLVAIHRIAGGIGRERAEAATVGLVAEELAIDPSRASRIASDLIQRGYLRREAAQDDGRKSVLVLTHKADDAFAEFRAARWERMLAAFDGWSEEEIATFSRLFARFVAAHRDSYSD
ncbi:hypothetical protein GCM10011392_25380 [Wenxinia marina]|nr:hypothetical protein GCM10011392_25380 [Wenxinia marina]